MLVVFSLGSFLTATLLGMLVWFRTAAFYAYDPWYVGPVLQGFVTVTSILGWYVWTKPKPNRSAYYGALIAVISTIVITYLISPSEWYVNLIIVITVFTTTYLILKYIRPLHGIQGVFAGGSMIVAGIITIFVLGALFVKDLAP